jgi:hypothetical protein
MKKLALALVCLVSVAFFASCDPEITNPEPTIAVITGENYVYDGQTIDVNTDYLFGVRAASNSQTGKELASFKLNLKIMDLEDNVEYNHDTTFAISGTEYVYQDTVGFTYTRELVGKAEITATAIDVDGKSCHVTIKLNVNQPAQTLEVKNFEWYRLGNTQTGLEEYGLYWHQNAKSPFAQIKPMEGVILYKFDSDIWDNIIYEDQKVAAFSDGATTASMYNNVDVNANALYDDVIGTRMPDGTLHLLHVTSCVIGAQQPAGRPIHIYGQAK